MLQTLVALGAKIALTRPEREFYSELFGLFGDPLRRDIWFVVRHIDYADVDKRRLLLFAESVIENYSCSPLIGLALLMRLNATDRLEPDDIKRHVASGLRRSGGRRSYRRARKFFERLGNGDHPQDNTEKDKLQHACRSGDYQAFRSIALSKDITDWLIDRRHPLLEAARHDLHEVYKDFVVNSPGKRHRPLNTKAFLRLLDDGDYKGIYLHCKDAIDLDEIMLRDGSYGDRRTLLSFAVNRGDDLLAAVLISAGCSRLGSEKAQESSLSVAAGYNRIAILRLLLWLGSDPNESAKETTYIGAHPMLESSDLGIIKTLIEGGGNPDYSSSFTGETPLTLAARRGRPETLRYLLFRGANVRHRMHDGTTALHETVVSDCKTAAKLLIAAGVDVHARNDRGHTALDFAMQFQLYSLSKVLRSAGIRDDYSISRNWLGDVEKGRYHVFLSYRHDTYASQARHLGAALRARGLRVFLDRDTSGLSDGERASDEHLKRTLFVAVSSACLTLFFEGDFKYSVDTETGQSVRAFNWQLFEQLYSRAFRTVKPPITDEDIDRFVRMGIWLTAEYPRR